MDTSHQMKNLNKLLTRIQLHLQVEFSNNITDDITKQIKNVLQKEQRENVMADEILMPAWIRTFIKQMYEL